VEVILEVLGKPQARVVLERLHTFRSGCLCGKVYHNEGAKYCSQCGRKIKKAARNGLQGFISDMRDHIPRKNCRECSVEDAHNFDTHKALELHTDSRILASAHSRLSLPQTSRCETVLSHILRSGHTERKKQSAYILHPLSPCHSTTPRIQGQGAGVSQQQAAQQAAERG